MIGRALTHRSSGPYCPQALATRTTTAGIRALQCWKHHTFFTSFQNISFLREKFPPFFLPVLILYSFFFSEKGGGGKSTMRAGDAFALATARALSGQSLDSARNRRVAPLLLSRDPSAHWSLVESPCWEFTHWPRPPQPATRSYASAAYEITMTTAQLRSDWLKGGDSEEMKKTEEDCMKRGRRRCT